MPKSKNKMPAHGLKIKKAPLREIDPALPPFVAELSTAAQAGDSAAALALIALGPKSLPNSLNGQGASALGLAAAGGHISTVEALLPHCDPLLADAHGFTPLMWAASRGQTSCVSLLLPVSSPLELDRRGMAAIEMAAWQSWAGVDCLAVLMDASPCFEGSKSLLSWAAMCPDTAKLAFLLARGADPRLLDTDGFSALHWAAKHGRDAAIDLLVAAAGPELALVEAPLAKTRLLPIECALQNNKASTAIRLCRIAPQTIARSLSFAKTCRHLLFEFDAFIQAATAEMERSALLADSASCLEPAASSKPLRI